MKEREAHEISTYGIYLINRRVVGFDIHQTKEGKRDNGQTELENLMGRGKIKNIYLTSALTIP